MKLLITTAVLALVLTACSAEKNHENTTETHKPTSEPTHTQGVVDDMAGAAKSGVDGVGNGVKDVGNAVKSTVK